MADSKLVSILSDQTYIALSYVWGGTNMLQTTNSNLSSLRQPGALKKNWEQLPRIIQDAILFVQLSGKRYLWIDSLCIIQDDETGKQQDIKSMDIIYNRAFFTIVALSAMNANSHLPEIRPNTRLPQVTSTIRKLPLAAIPADLYAILDNGSTYDSRAWTFQERLLSRRCLYFTEQQLYFQCYEATACEARRIPEWNDTLQFFNPLGYEVQEAEFQPGKAAEGLCMPEKEEKELYRLLVGLYTSRTLSYNADILNGFKGIMAVLRGLEAGGFVSGVPLRMLDAGLLWVPSTGGGVRRRSWKRNENLCSSWSGGVHYLEELRGGPLSERLRRRFEGLEVEPPVEGDDLHGEGQSAPIINHAGDKEERLHPELKPRILRFTTTTVPLSQFTILPGHAGYLYRTRQPITRILDIHGKHCGLLFSSKPSFTEATSNCELTLISSVIKEKYERNMPIVDVHARIPVRNSGYLSRYDEWFGGWEDGDSFLNVLLVEWKAEGWAERIALAQIHGKAWVEVGARERVVRLR